MSPVVSKKRTLGSVTPAANIAKVLCLRGAKQPAAPIFPFLTDVLYELGMTMLLSVPLFSFPWKWSCACLDFRFLWQSSLFELCLPRWNLNWEKWMSVLQNRKLRARIQPVHYLSLQNRAHMYQHLTHTDSAHQKL